MQKALLLTILVSLFFLIGMLIPKLFKNKNKLLLTTTSLTFITMFALILFDLLPEIFETLEPMDNFKNFIYIFLSSIIGTMILKTLDLLVPEHHHDHHDKNDNVEEHNSHMFHIGFITAISLMIHNLLEGISIYITGISDFKTGLLMALTVGCHNLPLGIEIAASLEVSQKNKISKYITLTILTLSSFLGAFFLFLLDMELSPFLEGILLSITLGMLIYISIFELLPEIIQNKKEKEIKVGLLLGILLALFLFFM